MEWEDRYRLDLLHEEMDRIATTNQKYLELEENRQEILDQLEDKLSPSEYELIEKLIDVMEVQNFLMLRSVLRIGII